VLVATSNTTASSPVSMPAAASPNEMGNESSSWTWKTTNQNHLYEMEAENGQAATIINKRFANLKCWFSRLYI
jgi:hypothetical protein